jgi:HSP20 family protein
MTIMRDYWSPLSALLDLNRRVNRLFETESGPRSSVWSAFPPVNLVEEEEKYVLTAEVPGVDPATIELSVVDDRLTLEGKRTPALEDRAGYIRQERGYGDFSRTIGLPERVAADEIEATCVNGLLTVTLPKVPEVRPKQITVKAG